ncbi:hypothetical protein BH10PSE14_BH10PSE14_06270 [soil metagenome]
MQGELALARNVPIVVPKITMIGPVSTAPMARYPRRLQRSRKRGAKTPAGAVYVGRPTLFNNPFRFERFGHARSVLLYGDWMEGRLSDLRLERHGFCPAEIDALHRKRERIHRNLHQLSHKDLVCWCPTTSKWCHADILLEHANEDLPKGFRFL